MPNHQGANNPHWKGGRSWRGSGENRYPVLLVEGKYIPEHRLLAARLIGRALHSRERVWFSDGNPTNLEPDNLRVVTASDYGKLRAKTLE